MNGTERVPAGHKAVLVKTGRTKGYQKLGSGPKCRITPKPYFFPQLPATALLKAIRKLKKVTKLQNKLSLI